MSKESTKPAGISYRVAREVQDAKHPGTAWREVHGTVPFLGQPDPVRLDGINADKFLRGGDAEEAAIATAQEFRYCVDLGGVTNTMEWYVTPLAEDATAADHLRTIAFTIGKSGQSIGRRGTSRSAATTVACRVDVCSSSSPAT